jgi:hypothetical protein
MPESIPEWLLKLGLSLIMLAFGTISLCAAVYVAVELVRYLR